ncbi:MAG TPA: antibiotic biosynthesis monooxygenase [Streptosporangiaceae bacterium]
MVTVGVLARFEARPGSEAEMASFFHEGLPLAQAQPPTTVWFAFRLSDTSYGAFAAFADAQDRDALLASGGPQLARKYASVFAAPPTFEKVDLLETSLGAY